ncbi:MAG: hypothetical protein A2Y24_06090 [Clostridiales bacterium GWE2_32_10]|nr:MAG: hypothetical protein A2Y24_06090 [Clostridiales bacterium GWE2_32_10]HBY21546.1 hypothetical protein [Clostridiales bacterium]
MIALIAPAGAGKTTIMSILCKKYGYEKPISWTTKKPRKEEIDGVDYNFITTEAFYQLEKTGFWAEFTKFNGAYYAYSVDDIKMENGILTLDIEGINTLTNNGNKLTTIYIDVDERTREERIRLRGDPEEAIAKRALEDNESGISNFKDKADYVVNNESDNPQDAACEIYAIMHSEMKCSNSDFNCKLLDEL